MSSKDWIEKDFYAVLGVDKAASADDIKKAYRKVARESHPDHNPGDPKAEERFKAASEAYNVLSDSGRRREYDEMRSLFGSGAFRRNARGGGQPGGMPFDVSDMFGGGGGGGDRRFGGAGFQDLFSSIFSGGQAGGQAAPHGPARGRDVETEVALDFGDAVRGVTLPLTLRAPGVCDTCHGNGAKPGTQPRTCPVCHGAGVTTRNQGSFSFSEPCRNCQGVGTVVEEKCPECHGSGGVTKTRTMNVRFPAGVADGQRIRLAGRGEPGERGGPAGDLFVHVKVRPDELFGRTGDDLTLTVPVTFAEAVLGTDLRVPTLDGAVTLRVPPGTPSGRVLRARGKGVVRRDGQAGDLLVTLDVVVPARLSDEARTALESFAEQTPPAAREHLDARVRRVS
ncbi:molecular chaperone DnaJ [Micromonospora noduli]|uniref:Chaperone protein DnaJ n=1 Tax=Micromonospora noduli TaxID=709876 RepID=A0A328N5X3_9ACTN|nr:molecular chaperone DnaJ [Micromonospora noduli]KAB1926775.1 molecular chaperone DnaJ [Micromonospora noduli]RAN97544.1 Chaperone protein DnaJ [Micromonospora noduli]RAO03650.1 Chaperone protein DnaJ [Micromonospora noduli]RAO15983.1 Chaperone protein DnaJ [Micromonospora noduli]RAO17343.1 Chaperone protein DnaJ [Micromonospora noduli]